MSAPIAVPTLTEISQNRAKLAELPFGALWALALEAGRLHAEIIAAMAPAMQTAVQVQGVNEDRALTIEQAAERLQVAPTTMKRWLRKSPFDESVVVRSRTCVRVSSQCLERILVSQGAKAFSRRARQAVV